jgi:hypothetical protein
MKRRVFAGCLLCAAAIMVPSNILAQDAPPGAIFNLDTVQLTPLTSYQPFSTSFVADNASEFVSFAFRETPRWFAFDDASVIIQGGSMNLLADPGFELASPGQNCNHNNSLGCPSGWGAWIQSVDVSAIGEVASGASTNCSPNGPHSGTNFWCDGSVEGYDAVYQQLTGLTVGSTYNIHFFLGDNSGVPPNQASESSQVDMLVYAGDSLPVGSIPLGTPEPGTLSLIGAGILAIGVALRKRRTA